MDDKIIKWNGYPVHGDTSLLNYIVESEGFINLDKDDIVNTLSNTGYNYVASGQAANLSEAFSDCLSKLSAHFHNASKILIQFICDSRQVELSELQQITTELSRINQDVSVLWGIAPDTSLGSDFKVIIVASA